MDVPPSDRRTGCVVALLDEDQHLEAVARIVQATEIGHELRDDLLFAKDRHQHGVERQLVFVEHRQFELRHLVHEVVAGSPEGHDELEQHAGQEEEIDGGEDDDECRAGQQECTEHGDARRDREPDDLASGEHGACRAHRIGICETICRLGSELCREHLDHGIDDELLAHRNHLDRCAEIVCDRFPLRGVQLARRPDQDRAVLTGRERNPPFTGVHRAKADIQEAHIDVRHPSPPPDGTEPKPVKTTDHSWASGSREATTHPTMPTRTEHITTIAACWAGDSDGRMVTEMCTSR